jgi:hypothetical protein
MWSLFAVELTPTIVAFLALAPVEVTALAASLFASVWVGVGAAG